MPDFGKFKSKKNLGKIFPVDLKVALPRFLISFFLNPWFFSFLKAGKFIQIILVAIISCWLVNKNKRLPKLFFFCFLFYLLFIQKPIPGTIFQFQEEEIYYLNQRRSYCQSPLVARFLENKVNRLGYKFKRNFFTLLDTNYYFFANHPRERPGIKETEKFFWGLLPFFLLGLFSQLVKKNYLAIRNYSLWGCLSSSISIRLLSEHRFFSSRGIALNGGKFG